MGCIPKTSPFEEMKLLEKAQQPPFNTYIRIHDYAETDVQQLASARCLSFVASHSKAKQLPLLPGASLWLRFYPVFPVVCH